MLIVVIVMFAAILALAFVSFDQLVRLEYKFHRVSWEADGKPHGFFWVPSQSKGSGAMLTKFGSTVARNRCVFSWLFSTPKWAGEEKRARNILVRYRLSVLAWNLGFTAIVLIICLR